MGQQRLKTARPGATRRVWSQTWASPSSSHARESASASSSLWPRVELAHDPQDRGLEPPQLQLVVCSRGVAQLLDQLQRLGPRPDGQTVRQGGLPEGPPLAGLHLQQGLLGQGWLSAGRVGRDIAPHGIVQAGAREPLDALL